MLQSGLESSEVNMRARSTLLAILALLVLAAAARAQNSQPVVCAVLVDGSKSVGANFAAVKESARAVIERLRSGDECMVARFVSSEQIKVEQEFTGDKGRLLAALDRLHTDEGQSAVVDAVFVTAQEVQKRAAGSKRAALVVVTDGDERASYYRPEKLFELLRSAGVRVYPVGITVGLKTDKRRKAEKLLARIAQESGGRAFFIESPAELTGVASDIDEAARR